MNFIVKTALLCFFAGQLLTGFTQNLDISGFGFDTNGGKGGEIIRVTNLNSTGEGSLAAAIQKSVF